MSDLEGPNSTFDTAWSSLLVALHVAVLSLKQGKCKVEPVTAVDLLFNVSVFGACAKAGMLSTSGCCHSWDTSTNGFLHGKGCGMIVLEAFNKSSSTDVLIHLL